ncbi:hypothetical protein [Corynebacterium timonense]|uniref:Uncharacterized protein n=1 Tax=Corynebacterium timonense TaxID=441500 RepID=A0A1H1LAG3_9CORY|nr:hypothetical protein [Corynebacterium timonense]SDR71015.1 hypothetical protein SAMN04488539_0115 [Corynebacterium timonense]
MHALRRLSAPPAAVALAAALAACGSVDPQDNAPVTGLVNEPEGFRPTADGTHLRFDEPAEVVTTHFSTGMPVYWEVTVHAPTRLTLQQVKDNIGQDPQRIGDAPPVAVRTFSCFPVTFTSLGQGLGRDDAPVSVELPSLTPVDGYGTNANYVGVGAESYCGLDTEETDTVPSYTGDMVTGRSYTTAVVTWEGQRDPGIVGTGVRLNTLVSPRNPGQPPQALTWGPGAP